MSDDKDNESMLLYLNTVSLKGKGLKRESLRQLRNKEET